MSTRKKLAKDENSQVVSSLKSEDTYLKELEQLIINHDTYLDDKRPLLRKFARKMAEKHSKKKNSEIEALAKEVDQHSCILKAAFTLDTKYHLVRVVRNNDTSAALQMCKELEQEFSVTTPSEKALVQVVVAAYMRMYEAIEHYNRTCRSNFVSHEVGMFVNIYAKEIDRSNKQFLAALQTLRQVKQPPLSVQVHAQTAFIAEKQQNIANLNNQ